VRALLRGVTTRAFGLIAFESTLIVSAVLFAAYLRLGFQDVMREDPRSIAGKALFIAVVCQLCFYFGDLYNLKVVSDRREMFIRIVQGLGVTSLILGVVYFWFPELVIGRGVFLIAALLVVVFVIGWRVAWDWLARAVGPRERLLIIGTNPAAITLARELYNRRELGVEIAGFITDSPETPVGTPMVNPGVIGSIEDIPELVRTRGVDRVVVSLADARGRLPMDKLLDMKLAGVTFDHLASVYEEYTGKIAVENLRPSWLIFSSGFRKSVLVTASKRVLDVCVAGVGFVVAFPLMLLTGLAIMLTSPGPLIYHQIRVGQNGKLFTIHKFRSMRADAEKHTGAVWAQKNDARITPIGRFLRRTRLDELPQLWNVIKGDMSLVGPRPERPEFVEELTKQIPFYGQRHAVKPGVTGWAQVSYTYGASVEDALEKLQYDLFYIKHLNLPLDLFIIFKTAKTVVLRRGT
jgi:sugar transferase (PEP-CTERM system associated)